MADPSSSPLTGISESSPKWGCYCLNACPTLYCSDSLNLTLADPKYTSSPSLCCVQHFKVCPAFKLRGLMFWVGPRFSFSQSPLGRRQKWMIMYVSLQTFDHKILVSTSTMRKVCLNARILALPEDILIHLVHCQNSQNSSWYTHVRLCSIL